MALTRTTSQPLPIPLPSPDREILDYRQFRFQRCQSLESYQESPLSEKSGSLVHQHSGSPVNQQLASPTKLGSSSPANQQPRSPVNGQLGSSVNHQLGSPMHQQLGSPGHQQLGSPVHQQLGSPVHQQLGSPVHQQLGSPVNQQLGSPVHQRLGSPVDQQLGSPVHQQLGSPVHQQLGSPVHQQLGSPVDQQPGSPVDQQPGSPVDQQPGSPVDQRPGSQKTQQPGFPANQQLGSPVDQQPGSPANQQFGSPVDQQPSSSKNQQPGSPANQQLGSPVDQQPGSPKNQKPGSPANQHPGSIKNQQPGSIKNQQPGSIKNQQPGSIKNQQPGSIKNQQPGSPVNQHLGSSSPVNQQSSSPSLQEQDDKQPASPTPFQVSASSPSSTDRGSAFDRLGKKTNARTLEYNLETEKSESLWNQQIILMRQKHEATSKVDLLHKIYNSMIHCKCCLTEHYETIIQSGDYTFDISLEESKLQSCNSQNSLANETLEDPMYNPDGPVDSLMPSNSMTNPVLCGEITLDSVLEFFESEQTRNNFVNRGEIQITEWSGQSNLTDSCSDMHNINSSNSQTIHEVEDKIKHLADGNTRSLMKRRNGFGDINKQCVKSTKQDDRRTATSSHPREKNEQEYFSVTEEKSIRRITTTGSGRRRHVIHTEVCIKPNEEKTAMPCSTESAVEANTTEPAVDSAVESLSETFTSAISLNKTEDINLVVDVTETVQDMKYSAQSGHGVMPEIKESGHAETPGINVKESMTETDCVAKTRDDTHVNLLEKSMKTLNICDTNKEGVVNTAKKSIEKVYPIKDAQESFAAAKNESYNTDDSALVKKNNKNLHMNNEHGNQSEKAYKLNNNSPSLSDSSTKKHLPANRPNNVRDAETRVKKTGKPSLISNLVSKIRNKIF